MAIDKQELKEMLQDPDFARFMAAKTGATVSSNVREYIGARYVPVFANPLEWSDSKGYEPLTIVTHAGNSYTSMQIVPPGVDISDTNYWTLTGNFNARVEQYRAGVAAWGGRIQTAEDNAASALTAANAAQTDAAQAKAAASAAQADAAQAKADAADALAKADTAEETASSALETMQQHRMISFNQDDCSGWPSFINKTSTQVKGLFIPETNTLLLEYSIAIASDPTDGNAVQILFNLPSFIKQYVPTHANVDAWNGYFRYVPSYPLSLYTGDARITSADQFRANIRLNGDSSTAYAKRLIGNNIYILHPTNAA